MGEAGGQSDDALAAVANVIKNRVDSGNYGDTPTAVVLQRDAFEPWSTRRRELQGYSVKSPEYQRAAQIVDDVFSGKRQDLTSGATHFYDPVAQRALGRAPPVWSSGRPLAAVGSHRFYAPQGAVVPDLLGSWNAAPAGAPTASAPAAAEPDDLLGSWNTGQEPPPSASGRQRIVIHPAGTVEPAPPPATNADEDVDLARSLAEHQGANWTDLAARLGIGALRGVKDVADTAAQGIAAAGRGGAGVLSNLGAISPETAAGASDWAAGVNARIAAERDAWARAAAESPSAQVGRIGGQLAVAGPAIRAAGTLLPAIPATVGPVARTALSGAGAGGAAAALTSSVSDEPLPQQIAEGALVGGALGPLGYGLGYGASKVGAGVRRAAFGAVDPETASLAGLARDVYGIPVTGGQISASPAVRFLDSVMQRLPFSGYGARTAEQQGALNRAVSNTFGEDTPKITMGTIQAAKTRIGKAFEDVANRTGPIAADTQFLTDLNRIAGDAPRVLTESELSPISGQLRDFVGKIDPATRTIDPKAYQSLTHKDAPLSRLQQAKDPNIRYYANQLRDALDDVMQRSAPPDVVDDLRDARRQWKALKTVEPLAKKATTGDIRPAALLAKVNQSYSGAGGDLGDLGRIGQRFLTEPNSSGTAERLLTMKALGAAAGAAGLGGAYAFDPEGFQRDALIGLAAFGGGRALSAGLRSNTLANALIRSGLQTPSGANPLANLLARAATPATLTYRGTSQSSARP